MARKLAFIEPFSVFGMIMAYIWSLRFRYHGLWVIILALMLLSHYVRRERAVNLGFHLRNIRECLDEFGPLLLFLTLAMLGGGILFATTRPIGFDQAVFAWAGYLPWGMFQQYILNGYFMNRVQPLVSHRSAPVVAAALFSSAHLPNWFLMAVTLLAGYCSARIYRRYHNLFFLGLAHATIGFLLFLVIPDSVTHHLIVGPGWFAR